jgi:hypothetical protein
MTATALSGIPDEDKHAAISFSVGTTQSFVDGEIMEECLASVWKP